jgi:hypothetical protein
MRTKTEEISNVWSPRLKPTTTIVIIAMGQGQSRHPDFKEMEQI